MIAKLHRVCVFCGSSHGSKPAYRVAAASFGTLLAGRGIGLVYGGSHAGLMGALADAALAAGGHVTGVIPQSLVEREVAHRGLSDLRIVRTMHDRKALMAELSDAFIALPGGFGTLDEFCEVLTWAQLGLHRKPCGILNTEGYYDPFLMLLDRSVSEGFLKPEHRDMVLADSDPQRLLDRLAACTVPQIEKWIAGPRP